MTDHTAEAQAILTLAGQTVSANWPEQFGDYKSDVIAEAQVHAILAVAAAIRSHTTNTPQDAPRCPQNDEQPKQTHRQGDDFPCCTQGEGETHTYRPSPTTPARAIIDRLQARAEKAEAERDTLLSAIREARDMTTVGPVRHHMTAILADHTPEVSTDDHRTHGHPDREG